MMKGRRNEGNSSMTAINNESINYEGTKPVTDLSNSN